MTFDDLLEEKQVTLDRKKMEEEDATMRVVTVYCDRCGHTIQKRIAKDAVFTECPSMTRWGVPDCFGTVVNLHITEGPRGEKES